MSIFKPFGDRQDLHIRLQFEAATAVDRELWANPSTSKVAYRLVHASEVHSVVGSTNAALRLRKITDTSAPGASAGATVIEQAAAFDLTATINTRQVATLTGTEAQRTFKPGDRLCVDASGTMGSLAGGLIDCYFEPVYSVI